MHIDFPQKELSAVSEDLVVAQAVVLHDLLLALQVGQLSLLRAQCRAQFGDRCPQVFLVLAC